MTIFLLPLMFVSLVQLFFKFKKKRIVVFNILFVFFVTSLFLFLGIKNNSLSQNYLIFGHSITLFSFVVVCWYIFDLFLSVMFIRKYLKYKEINP